jgi:two-component system sensor histidine kinase UhpB
MRTVATRRRYLPLFARIVLANLLVLAVACVIVVAVSPHRISGLTADEVLVATLFCVTLVNVVLVRRIVLPLQQLTALARGIDPARPGVRFAEATAASEAGELALTFNEMLDRIEHERAESARAVLLAQEAERTRVAQELHDEVGQALTAVLLQLSRVQRHVAGELEPALNEAQETVRDSLDDVRRIATELRPETLSDLGLASALANLADTFARRTGIDVERHIASELPPLASETELALYRVAQEALTNVARHSGSKLAELSLSHSGETLSLVVRDHGRGLPETGPAHGNGLRGMRERASAIGAELTIGAPAHGSGSEVNLVLALADAV